MIVSMWVSPVIPQGLINISIPLFNTKFNQEPLNAPNWVFKYKEHSGTRWAVEDA